MPRLLATDRLTARLETEIANLVGQEGALVFPSTTHLALDVLPLLAGPNGVLFIDEWAYPISLQGAHVAVQHGARIHRFPHNDYQALARALQACASIPDKVIVCDGVYPARGQPAPLREIAGIARAFDAVVYVDDAHGIGVLGSSPTREMPYGRGGVGTPRHLNVAPGNVAHVGSLSKAFGVPVAFVAGPAGFINYLRATRLFPIQTLRFVTPRHAEAAGRELRRMGVWAVLQFKPPDHPKGGVLRFVLSARHQEADIDEAIVAISHTLRFVLDPSVVVVRQ